MDDLIWIGTRTGGFPAEPVRSMVANDLLGCTLSCYNPCDWTRRMGPVGGDYEGPPDRHVYKAARVSQRDGCERESAMSCNVQKVPEESSLFQRGKDFSVLC